ncbi:MULTISPECIES: SHOCT domain-containing protein [unclassified Isoptericola]|uniref:SHOCT domain-containing protein n=1 Tax=unclassified Isoptericola TaxID=2623355 RepID=UPI0027142D86|nr:MULTISPECIES: SHOCT domain-containing protein [unclassified Isoptericola]MDO8144891.1 SHOCT domain-containing protein [Isoptericola sp. 178]MDO8149670.1 SHOCT domain-containing protein [Isoptericola sp. b515]MDO8152605.1 SHOCT domain-containing protein [Isoptericola sp. b408]
MMGDGFGMGWMWLVWPLIVVGVVLVVLAVVLAVRSSGNSRGGGQAPPATPGRPPSRAEEILDERYARGELTDEEYQDRRRRLRDGTER